MLKLKILFSALLLTASINTLAFCIHNHTFAFCVQNQTMKSIYFRSDILTHDIEITPNNKYCGKALEDSANFGIFVINTVDMFIVCASIHSGVKNNILVVSSGDHPICIAS